MDDVKNESKFNIDELTDREKIIFRRASGRMLADAPNALTQFYRILPEDVSKSCENKYFTVLCLACKYDKGTKTSFQQILNMARITEGDNAASLDRRIDALMTTSWNDEDGLLAVKLSQIMTIIGKSVPEIKPDFDELYNDLKGWDNPSKYVQRKWARTIYSSSNN